MSPAGPVASTSKLPPGVVLGPDGKPCKVCSGFKAWSAAQAKKSTSAPLAAFSAAVAQVADEPPADCPADVDRLGRHTWTFLHTTAAYYPAKPSESQKSAMSGLLSTLPVIYPCSHCASDLGNDLKRNPPDVSSGDALRQWMCVLHNGVNEKLGKDKFDCSKVDERWKDGWRDGHCGG